MAENNEINTSPTLVDRVAKGVKDGVVGAAIGAAAGAVTGGVLSALDFSSDVTQLLTPDQATEYNDLGKAATTAKEAVTNFTGEMSGEMQEEYNNLVRAAKDAVSAQKGFLAESILSLPQDQVTPYLSQAQLMQYNNIAEGAYVPADAAEKLVQSVADGKLSALFRQDVIDGAKELVPTGAVVGGTYKGLEGLVNSQPDKRQDIQHAMQEQQIQGVGQMASMALAASANANEGLKVLGQHTARLMQERGQPRTVDQTTTPGRI